MIHLPLSHHELAHSSISKRHACSRDHNPPQGLSSATQRSGIDRRPHKYIPDAIHDGHGIYGPLRVGQFSRRGTFGGALRVWELEEGERRWWADKPQDPKADKDGGVEARHELEIRERGEHHDL